MSTKYPSTTQILKSWGLYDGLPLLEPQKQQDIFDRGILIGKAANWLARGLEPRWSAPHPELEPTLNGVRLFLREHTFQLLTWEQELSSPIGYISHPDWIGILDGKLSIVEIKTGVYNARATELQTAGQLVAWESGNERGREGTLRYCLHLAGDGKYSLIPHTNFRDKSDWIALAQGAITAMRLELPLGLRLREIMEADKR